MTATISITESNILTALGNFLVGALPAGVTIVRGQDNQVVEPLDDFVVMTPMLRNRLATNVDSWLYVAAPTTLAHLQSVQVTVQIDVYGPNSGDYSQIVSTLLRDAYACDVFEASGFDIQPLYAGDPTQRPFINGEGQYENRWGVDAVLQANPIVSSPQDFANVLTPTIPAPVA